MGLLEEFLSIYNSLQGNIYVIKDELDYWEKIYQKLYNFLVKRSDPD